VGATANFFALGGHSLLATRVVSAVQAQWGKRLSVRAVFEQPTVRGLAALIDALGADAQAPIVRADRDAPLALSYAQQRLWFVDQLGGSRQYNMPVALRLRGALDVDALQGALDALVARHEVLRTVYAQVDGEAVQVIRPAAPVPIAVVDLTDAPTASIDEPIALEAARPFDLSGDLMLRATRVILGDEDHVLLFTMHHIASDGWSVGLAIAEFAEAYAAQHAGRDANLAVLPVQYADYAQWQRAQLQGAALERQLGYWSRQLADAPAVHGLPLDRPRLAAPDLRGGTIAQRIDRVLADRLNALAREHDATPFILLQAAFAALVARWSGESDIVIGTPIAGRMHRDIEELIGFFVNTLVLRTQIDADTTFADLLAQSRRTSLDAYAHQDVPFEMLVDRLQPERSLAHTPLFQLMFQLQNTERASLDLPGLSVSTLAGGEPVAKFDLDVAVQEDANGLSVDWTYARAIFDHATIERLADGYAQLLAAVVETPNLAVAHLPLAQEASWDPATVDYPTDTSLATLFEAQVARQPDAIAIVDGTQSLTYAQLNDRANRLAHALLARGIDVGQRVGLGLARSTDFVVGVLAAWKIGAAYVPLDPSQPAERLSYLVADSAVSVVLARGNGFANALDLGDALFEAELAQHVGGNLDRNDSGDRAAYLIYTSGSTGRPKGVVIEQRALCHLAANLAPTGIGDGICRGRWGWVAPVVFDASVQALVQLAHGGTLCVIPDAAKTDAGVARATLDALRPDVMDATPALVELWLAQGLDDVLPDLVIGGEAIAPALWRHLIDWQARHARRAINVYGPTECTVDSTWAPIAGDVPNIGQCLPNLSATIRSANGQVAPPGAVGELYLAGAGLARGYHDRAELTAERFVTLAGQRWYRTGDRVRRRNDGAFEFLGRSDDQVKLRGFRIEPGEIESRLRALDGVTQAVVVVRGTGETRRLVGYVVARDGAIDPQALRTALQQQLPDYMVPAQIVALDALPLTGNGKVDKRALPEPDVDDAAVEPATPTESALAQLWSELLKREPVGVTTNFFALGGHSLLATRMVSAIAERLHRTVPVRAVFEYPSVRTLAAFVDAQAASAHQAIAPVLRDTPLVLSYAQQRLWFIDQLDRGSARYNMPVALRLRGALDVAALQGALDTLVARHEVLRTVYAQIGGEAVQVIRPATSVPVAVVDLSEHASLDERIALEAAKPFDLSNDLMLRATRVIVGDGNNVLLFTMHHIASDGWSVGLAIAEFANAYAALQAGQQPNLAPLPVQYADYAQWQRTQLQGAALERQIGYWSKQLADAPAVHGLPLDRLRPATQDLRGGTITQRIDRVLTDRLSALARDHDATPFMLLQAAFAALVARWSGESDIVIGTPIAGRTHRDIEGLIGFFVNTLV
ncbi:MAG TPA: amino acid adenylation domain-containing protein, partial [Tahibacter sp.]|nr:amino acid adenylation domain-containing protein [Tahibacter sp.]